MSSMNITSPVRISNLMILDVQLYYVISVVGIPGVGKTTLAKQVYDQVRNNFDYYALITVSQSYSAEGLLRRLLDELCKVKKEDPPKGVSNMESLTEEVRNRCATRGIKSLPKSIGKLQNLETLDIRDTSVSEMPEEIRKLKNLRHLLSDYISSIQWKDIGGMTSLQEIPPVIIDDDGVVVIREVGKLKQLRELWVVQLSGKHEKTLCSVINEMPHLEKLRIRTADESEVIDLYITSPMSTLRKLDLSGTLTRFTNWISQFPNLVH